MTSFLITANIAGLKGYLHPDGQFHLAREGAKTYASRSLARHQIEKFDLPTVKLEVESEHTSKVHAFSTKSRDKAAAFIQYAEDTEGMEFHLATSQSGIAVYYKKDYDKQVVSAVIRNFNQEWRAFS